ncbi:MAG: indole-3-glycerol phosphate synthase TrpC [Rhodospirillaceae bacterium]|nr:indole-3-glycerol phosphate synthase TrpC [Rhodospirillaceae bacterium]
MNRLDPILARRREAVAASRARYPLEALREACAAANRPAFVARDFRAAIAAPGLSAIAEIKRRSPSAGALKQGADAAATAAIYAGAGARALSVLTEPDHFGGSLDDLKAARATVTIPVLRKDFIVDPYQIVESRAAGADAILLIVAALGARTGEFLAQAAGEGLHALVEVHDEDELRIAIDAGADIVGINNRNLTDLSVDLETFERLAPLLPSGVFAVAESGVETRADAVRMRRAGAHAILVGTALMRAPDPAAKLRELLA